MVVRRLLDADTPAVFAPPNHVLYLQHSTLSLIVSIQQRSRSSVSRWCSRKASRPNQARVCRQSPRRRRERLSIAPVRPAASGSSSGTTERGRNSRGSGHLRRTVHHTVRSLPTDAAWPCSAPSTGTRISGSWTSSGDHRSASRSTRCRTSRQHGRLEVTGSSTPRNVTECSSCSRSRWTGPQPGCSCTRRKPNR